MLLLVVPLLLLVVPLLLLLPKRLLHRLQRACPCQQLRLAACHCTALILAIQILLLLRLCTSSCLLPPCLLPPCLHSSRERAAGRVEGRGGGGREGLHSLQLSG